MKDHDTAIKIYDKIQTIKPTYVPAVYNKGVTLLNQEDYKSAISEFKKALTLDPNDPTILTNLGNAYAKSDDAVKAKKSMEKAVSLNPNTVDALTAYNQGAALIQSGEYEKAFKVLDRAAKAIPDSLQISEKRDDSLYALGKYQQAEKAYRDVVNKIPDIPYKENDDHDKVIKKSKLASEAHNNGQTADVKQQEEELDILEWIPITRIVLEAQRATSPTPAFAQTSDAPIPGTTIEQAAEEKVCDQGVQMVNWKCVVSTGDSDNEGGCLITTAAYGIELAPQIQFLRKIRDNTVMSTASGVSFMSGFNSLYYSFSPYIADMERENPMFQEAVRAFIAPMILTLSIMTLVDEDSEGQVLGLGISVIVLNLGMYIATPALIGLQVKKTIESKNH